MYRPFLLVGLGGSGGKTLRFVKRDLHKRLRAVGWNDGIPEGWQFLHIDTPTIADGQELNDIVAPLDNDEYAGLVGDGVTFRDVANQLDATPNLASDLVGWRIDAADLKVPIGVGAGQFRAVGRTVAMVHGREIRNRIRNSFDRISTPGSYAELGELYQRVTGNSAAASTPSPHVIVVSSLAGGTGAGLLMNVCDLINEIGESDGVMAMLYTPEVFGSVSGAGGGVYPNSLAAISEVLNGYWWHGDNKGLEDTVVRPRKNTDLLQAGAASPLSSGGPNYPFLIGLRNAEGASFGSDTSLFGMVGSAISTWMTDIGVQDRLIAYQQTNWENSARSNMPGVDVLVNSGDSGEVGIPSFQALGVARLSIGLDYFERYVAERLALDAAKFVATAHLNSDDARAISQRLNSDDPRVLARGVAELHLPVFLKRALLAEQGPDENMVIDAIRPDAAQMKRSALDTAMRLSEIGVGGTANSSAWEQRIYPALDQALRDFGKDHLAGVHEQVKEWVTTVPDKVLFEVEEMISQFGLRVTAAMLRQAKDYFVGDGDNVVNELLRDAEMYREWASTQRIHDGVASQLQGLGAKIPNDHQALDEAVQEGLHYGYFIGEAQVCEQAAAMLASFADKFLGPLAIDLEQHANKVDAELQNEAVNWAPWLDGEPPTGLMPPPSEVTLIEPDEFSPLFKELLAESFPDAANDELQRWAVRQAIISGSFLREDDALDVPELGASNAVEVRVPWWPGTTVVPDDLRTQADAVFTVALRPTELLTRASAWMRRPNTPFAKLMGESLRSYLQADSTFRGNVSAAEYEKRQMRFAPKLNQTLQASAPLVNLDSGLMGTVHPKLAGSPFSRVISDLPFRNHAIQDQVESLLLSQMDGQAAKVSEMLTTDATVDYVNVVSTLSAPCSPLVFESLLRPIAEEWSINSQTPMQRQQFWLRRRARRLEEFVPAPQELVLAMCRGWFVGVALGVIDRDRDPVTIGRDGDSPVTFPRVPLTGPKDKRDLLATTLESLALGYVEVSQRSDLQALEAFIQLRELGRSTDEKLYSYDAIGPLVSRWASTGVAPGAISKCLADGDSEMGRLEALHTLFKKTAERYETELEQLQDQWRKNPGTLGEKPSWPGIASQVLQSLDQLASAVLRRIEELGNDASDDM